MYSFHSFHPFNPCKDASKRCRKRGASATYKGAEKGDVTESRKWEPQGRSYYLEKKACVGLEAVHPSGAVPFLDSPSTSFPSFDHGGV